LFRRTSICALLFAALALTSQLAAQTGTSFAPTRDLLAAARQSRIETASRLQAGIGVGSVRHFQFEPGQIAPITTIDADIQVYFEAPKFHLRLQYATRVRENLADDVPAEDKWVATGLAEQVVIFDGETTYSVEFTVDGKCHGDVYFDFNCQNVLRSAGLPFENPVQLWPAALDIERADLEQAKLTQLAGGGFMGVLTKETYRMKFYFLDHFDFDLRRVSSYRTGEDTPFRDCLLQWRESNGVHYVRRFVTKVSDRPAANGDAIGPARRELEVEYTTFDANVPIDGKWFDVTSIAMPHQTQFDDHRFNVNGKPKVLSFDGAALRENAD
jgi:hypothetical protein